jgi:hypothetical protein
MRKPDLARARRDLAYFSKLVGWPLAKWQAEALALKARVTYVLGPRQSGKSRSVAVLAAHRAFETTPRAVFEARFPAPSPTDRRAPLSPFCASLKSDTPGYV